MGFVTALITLSLVLDPFGNMPVLLTLLPESRSAPRRYCGIVLREGLIALAVLTGFLFGGRHILRAMGVSEAALSLAGGAVLFMIAIRMVFPNAGHAAPPGAETPEDQRPLVVPIAIPLIAGPGALATVMLMAASYPERLVEWFAALSAAWGLSMVILLAAPLVSRLLGRRVMSAVERLMGMVLVTVAMEMLLKGARMALKA